MNAKFTGSQKNKPIQAVENRTLKKMTITENAWYKYLTISLQSTFQKQTNSETL